MNSAQQLIEFNYAIDALESWDSSPDLLNEDPRTSVGMSETHGPGQRLDVKLGEYWGVTNREDGGQVSIEAHGERIPGAERGFEGTFDGQFGDGQVNNEQRLDDQDDLRPDALTTPEPAWNPLITNTQQARAWLLANPRNPVLVRLQGDNFMTELSRFSIHAKYLFDALSSDPLDAKPELTPTEVLYYNNWQAKGMAEVDRLMSTTEGCERAQSYCFLAIEEVFALHGNGTPASHDKMKLDSELTLPERIKSMASCLRIKNVAVDVIKGKSDTMSKLVKNPKLLLASREHCSKNNSAKQIKLKAGREAMGLPERTTIARPLRPTATPRRRRTVSNFQSQPTSGYATSFTIPSSKRPEDIIPSTPTPKRSHEIADLATNSSGTSTRGIKRQTHASRNSEVAQTVSTYENPPTFNNPFTYTTNPPESNSQHNDEHHTSLQTYPQGGYQPAYNPRTQLSTWSYPEETGESEGIPTQHRFPSTEQNIYDDSTSGVFLTPDFRQHGLAETPQPLLHSVSPYRRQYQSVGHSGYHTQGDAVDGDVSEPGLVVYGLGQGRQASNHPRWN